MKKSILSLLVATLFVTLCSTSYGQYATTKPVGPVSNSASIAKGTSNVLLNNQPQSTVLNSTTPLLVKNHTNSTLISKVVPSMHVTYKNKKHAVSTALNHPKCLADEITTGYIQQQTKADPLYAKNAAVLKQSILNIINSGTHAKKQAALYTVPVVVHVVHNTSNPSENVSDAVIFDMIATLNEDFQRLNPDTVNTRSVFLSDAADAQIEFCLASKDPGGASTTGITRTTTTVSYFTSSMTNDMKSAPDGIAGWDAYKYLNIWVCNISNNTGFGIAGYAYLPTFGMHGSSIDGLVLDFDIGIGFGDRTATHEIGHYLGLGHTWGSNPPSCSGDDGFTDTPNSGTEQYGCNTSLNSCGTTNGDQIENYMSYANCQNMFSNDQAAYMQTVLTNTRASLLTSSGCEPTAAPIADFSVPDTLIIVGSNAQFTDLSSGIPDTWSWTFGGGGTPNTSTAKNPNILFSTIGTYNVYLVASNSLGSDDTLKTAYIDVIALPPCGIPGAFYCEDFESPTAPALPTGVSTSTAGTDAGFITGDDADANTAGFWPVPAHTQFAMTNDDDCNCDKSVDYLILPTFDMSSQSSAMGIQFEGYDDGLYGQNPSTVEMNINSGGWNIIYTFAPQAAWQSIRLPLTGAAGASSVQIRFHYDDGGSWATGLAVDDIVIYALPDNDLALSVAVGDTRDLTPWLTPEFYQIPVRQMDTVIYNARVSNLGALTQPNSIITVNVSNGSGSQFSGTSSGVNLAAATDSLFTVTTGFAFNPTDTGLWSTTFIASSDSTDDYPSNDGVISYTTVTDTVFARDNNVPWYQLDATSFVSTSPYEFANFYEFSNADTITSITMMLGPGTVHGTTIRGHIWNDALTLKLESTAFHVVDTATDLMLNFLTLNLQSPLPVAALSNVFASIEEFAGDDTSMQMITTWQLTGNGVPGYLFAGGSWGAIAYHPFVRINMASSAKGCIDSLTVTSTNAACGVCDGDVSVAVNGGNAPFTYLWDDGLAQTTTTAGSLCQGSYSVRVLDTYGCESISGISITDGSGLGLTVISTAESCGNANGTATATATGGSTPYTYTWTGGQTSSTATSLVAGTYHVTIEDAGGCTIETDFFNAANIGNVPPPTANADNDASICGSVTFTTNGSFGSSALSASWSTSGTGTFNDTTLLIAIYTPSAADVTAGSVSLTLTTDDPDGAGACTAATDVMVLTIDGEATASAGGDDAICEGDTYTLAGTRGGTASTSTWTGGTGLFSNASLVNAVYTPSAGDITAGTVTLTITTNDPAGVCDAVADSMVLTINAAATASAGAADAICEGSTYTLSGSRGGSASSSTWTTSGGGGFNNTGIVAAIYTPDASDITAGTVTLTITTDDPDGAGPCAAAVDVMVLTINAVATAAAGSDASICAGSPYVLSGSIGGSASILAWTSSGTGTFNDTTSATAAYTASAADVIAGTITLTITTDDPDAAGPCAAATDDVVLTLFASPTVSIGASTDILCTGDNTGAATAAATGGTGAYTYIWSDPATQTNITATGLLAGQIGVTVIDANTCMDTVSVVLTEPTTALSGATGSLDASCGIADGVAYVAAAGGTGAYTYFWDDPSSQTTDTATGLLAGPYNVMITDGNNCMVLAAASVNDAGAPTATVSSIIGVTCFGDSDGSAMVSATGGATPYTYTWTTGGSSTAETGMAGGSQSVTVEDSIGCVSVVNITINEPAALTISSETKVDITCNGLTNGSIAVVAAGGTGIIDFSIDSGITYANTSGAFTGLTAGTYKIAVSDSSGCETIGSTMTISEPSVIVISSETPSDASCNGTADGAIAIVASGGTGTLNYSIDTGTTFANTTGMFSALSAATYGVAVEDANGCPATGSMLVVNEPTAVTIGSQTNTNIFCNGGANGTITIVASGGTGTISYSIDGGLTYPNTTGTFSALLPGTYNIAAQDASGCPATGGGTLTITEPTTLTTSTSPVSSNCGQADGSATVTATGGTAPFIYAWNDPGNSTTAIITGLLAGTYNVTVTDSAGCTSTDVAIVTDAGGGGTAAASAVQTLECNADCDGSVQVTITGGTPPYVYAWDDAGTQSTQTATGLCAGTYSVNVTYGGGCTATASVTLSEPAAALTSTATASPSTTTPCDGSAIASAAGGTSPYTYLWNDPGTQVTPTAVGLCPGDATVIITDANGCTTTASDSVQSLIGIVEATHVVSLDIYPNPNQGSFKVAYDFGTSSDAEISIYNTIGALLMKHDLGSSTSGIHTIDLSGHANGIYYVQLITNQGTIIKKVSLVR